MLRWLYILLLGLVVMWLIIFFCSMKCMLWIIVVCFSVWNRMGEEML